MPESLRFYLDEHVDPAIAEGLRRRGIDALTTAEAGLLNASDEKQMALAEAQGRVLVTHDADFLRIYRTGKIHPGIIYCHQQSRSIGEIVRSLVLMWENLEAGEMKNHIQFI